MASDKDDSAQAKTSLESALDSGNNAGNIHAGTTKPFKPADLQQLSPEEQHLWEEARVKEYTTLIENKTFIDERPIDDVRHYLRLGETLKLKRDGTRKSRMYVQGCCQVPGRDFDLSYSPTISHMGFRLFLALVMASCSYNGAADFISAYTQSILPVGERVWCRMVKKFRKYGSDGRELVHLLGRSLYGLVQSGRNWYLLLSGWLTKYGFIVAFSEPCLYMLYKGDSYMILVTYVDDVPWGSNDMKLVAQVFADMERDGLKLTWDIGLTEVLGADLQHSAEGVTLHQSSYLRGLFDTHSQPIKSYEAELRDTVKTPCNGNLAKEVIEAAAAKEINKNGDVDLGKRFRTLVGALLYAAIVSNPDIMYTVGQLCRVMAFPTENLWQCAVHCLVYLKHRGAMGIMFYKSASASPILSIFRHGNGMVRGLVDASWEVVRSTSGWMIFVNGCLVAWGSKKQSSIGLSTNETEVMAASMASQDIVKIRNAVDQLGWKQTRPSALLGDSKGAKALADNPIMKGLAKHILRRELYVREQTQAGVLRMYHVQTELNVSDMLTKALATNKFLKFRGLIMVRV